MEILTIILLFISIILSVYSLLKINKINTGISNSNIEKQLEHQKNELIKETHQITSALRTELNSNTTNSFVSLASMLKETLDTQFTHQRNASNDNSKQQNELLTGSLTSVFTQLANFEKRLSLFSAESEQKLDNIRRTVDENLKSMREDNNKKLDEMRKTVDEKLQTELEKRMRDSFSQVSLLLENVQKDIGSMKNLAEDVGGLKKSLTNVKVRGMMGEFQLESILTEVFPQNQYEKNAHTNPDNASAVVEFAIKIPTDDDEYIYLPIDSKFPRDTYDNVIAASESGDKALLDAAIKAYIIKLKECAKDISTKYIAPPFTTDYAIMFLPTESMYADAVNHGMLEELFRSYRIYITGPSTITALLGSMQLSFSNMAIQKRASEVFGVLTEVQSEFSKFAEALEKMKKHLDATSTDLSDLMGVRTRQLSRKLNNAKKLSVSDDMNLLTVSDEDM